MCSTAVPQYMVLTLLSDRIGLSAKRGNNERGDEYKGVTYEVRRVDSGQEDVASGIE